MIRIGGILGRYVLVWIVTILALLLATAILPGVRIDTDVATWWITIVLVPVEFAFLIILLRPLLLFLTLPLNGVTLGLPSVLFNGLILYLAAQGQEAFTIANLQEALLAALIMTAVSAPIVSLLDLDEAYPLYQTLLFRFGRRWGPQSAPDLRRGLLILQIDGLSFRALVHVLRSGRMPTLSGLLARHTHLLHRWFCGLPSNTPAVQAGLFYGNRFDVPGYRWFDRESQTIRVVSHPADARALEERAEAGGGEPLLRGGSAVNTLLSGGADKRLLTVSALGEAAAAARPGERADLNLFYLSPNAYTKALLTATWEYLSGFTRGLLSLLRRDRPHLRNHPVKLAQGAVFNGFLRSVSFFWLKQDVVRNVPVIYTNFVGYDDVAHVTSPTSYEAQVALAAFDRSLRQLRRFARRNCKLDYELLVFSDHGHTSSMPFRLLYGQTFGEWLAEIAGSAVTEDAAASPEVFYLSVLLAQLEAERPRATLTARGGKRALAGLSQRRLQDADRQYRRFPTAASPASEDAYAPEAPELVVCVSGCLAHIYVKGHEEPLHLEEVMDRYPGLVPSLVAHPGIGFVAASRAFGDAVAIGHDGVRNLITGQLAGLQDPLAPFGDPRQLAPELAQLLSYPSAGDLVVNGAWLDDTHQVVVLEEQLSSHGGVGGPQMEPFVIVPEGWRTRPEDLRSPEALHRHISVNLRRMQAQDGVKKTP